jgi:acetyltransferase-like isoleucine patch superfamily enzyme
VLGDHIKLYRDVQLLLFGPHASITIGDGTFINWSTDVVCREAVTIGAGCAIGWRVIITDSDFHELAGGRPPTATVTIADHVWVGAGSIILKGVTVGEGAVVAAGAVVTADVAPGSIVAGNPAREIRSGVTWRGLT